MFEKIRSFAKQIKTSYLLFEATVLSYIATYTAKAVLRSWTNNKAGAMGLSVVGAIIGIAVGAYVVASTIPAAVVSVTNETNWEGAPDTVKTLGTLVLGIVVVVACIIIFLRLASGSGD